MSCLMWGDPKLLNVLMERCCCVSWYYSGIINSYKCLLQKLPHYNALILMQGFFGIFGFVFTCCSKEVQYPVSRQVSWGGDTILCCNHSPIFRSSKIIKINNLILTCKKVHLVYLDFYTPTSLSIRVTEMALRFLSPLRSAAEGAHGQADPPVDGRWLSKRDGLVGLVKH